MRGRSSFWLSLFNFSSTHAMFFTDSSDIKYAWPNLNYMINWICMQALPIFLDDMFNELVAVLLSVTLVLAFGEVRPAHNFCLTYNLYSAQLVCLIHYWLQCRWYLKQSVQDMGLQLEQIWSGWSNSSWSCAGRSPTLLERWNELCFWIFAVKTMKGNLQCNGWSCYKLCFLI